MSSYHLPLVTSIPALSTVERATILDALFEPCTALHTLSVELLGTETFESYTTLVAHIGQQLTDLLGSISISDTEWLDQILSAHPRLGGKKVDSEQSRGEQAALNTGGGEQEVETLRELNSEYEETFPGLRYVVFVNGRGRAAIMEDMRARIARRDINLERADAIKAMCEIAEDRARKLQQKAP